MSKRFHSIMLAMACLMMTFPAFANPEDIAAVADDTRFEHIYEHLHYRPSGLPLPSVYNNPPGGGNYDSFWIDLLVRGRGSTNVPSGLAEAMDNAPAHIAQIDAASRGCRADYFQRDMNNYRTYVIDKVQLELSRAIEWQVYYRHQYDRHRTALAELVPQSSGAWGKAATTASFGKGVYDAGSGIVNGAKPLGTFTVLGTAKNVLTAIREIFGYNEARQHAVLALANLKMALLYEHRVVPYLEDMIRLYRRNQSVADQRFSASYCHQCQCVIGSPEHPGASGTGPSCTPPAQPAPPAASPRREPARGPNPDW